MNGTDAIDGVCWYNGFSETIFNWRNLPIVDKKTMYPRILCPKNYGFKSKSIIISQGDIADVAQLQVLWMMAVCLFGGYGTSPRYGWIEDIDGFRQWCLDVTETWRSSDEYTGPAKYRVE